ncbi:MAG: hypothetical protein AAF682_02930 [Planctomycetota bacterium]
MKHRSPAALAALASSFLLSGCILHGGHGGYHRPHGKHVVISGGHVHTTGCGHYAYRGRWYHAGKHVHGPGCGHHFSGGIWVSK